MKAITANPETIRVVFSKKYLIPDFQRPYSWEKEQCEKLWDDIIDFHEQKQTKEDSYFLGNIVINPSSDSMDSAWEVVDGQQRLTTLLLLIKALHARAGTVKALEECLRIKDPLTSDLTDELRVSSCVISADRENLQTLILGNAGQLPDCRLSDNYAIFSGKIDDWWSLKGQTTDALNGLILTLLDGVVLLPIHCGSEDDALTIFETINNRGMLLADADIFKAKLYHGIPKDAQGTFIDDWNALDDHDWLFRVLMHILRAKAGDSSKEIGMRSFFTAKSRLGDYEAIMKSLKTVNAIYTDWYGSDEINSLWFIMNTYPNYYWNFPLYVFLHKYGVINETSGEFVLPDARMQEFTKLLEATVRYFFIKGVVHNSVNAVRDTVYKICVDIEAGKNYLSDYEKNITAQDKTDFAALLHTNRLRRYQRGIVLLAAYLHPKQDKEAFSEFVVGRYDIEHILPKKWNNYDGWTDDLWDAQLNLLGNLVPLSKSLNIAARNEFFSRKQAEYAKSTIQDAKDLVSLAEWTPKALEKKQEEKIGRLLAFCRIKGAPAR